MTAQQNFGNHLTKIEKTYHGRFHILYSTIVNHLRWRRISTLSHGEFHIPFSQARLTSRMNHANTTQNFTWSRTNSIEGTMTWTEPPDSPKTKQNHVLTFGRNLPHTKNYRLSAFATSKILIVNWKFVQKTFTRNDSTHAMCIKISKIPVKTAIVQLYGDNTC